MQNRIGSFAGFGFRFEVGEYAYSVDPGFGLSGEPFRDGVLEARAVGVGGEVLYGTLSVGLFSNENRLRQVILDRSGHDFRRGSRASVHEDRDLPARERCVRAHAHDLVFGIAVTDFDHALAFRYEVREDGGDVFEVSARVVAQVDDELVGIGTVLFDPFRRECELFQRAVSERADFDIRRTGGKLLEFDVFDFDFRADDGEGEVLRSALDVDGDGRTGFSLDLGDGVFYGDRFVDDEVVDFDDDVAALDSGFLGGRSGEGGDDFEHSRHGHVHVRADAFEFPGEPVLEFLAFGRREIDGMFVPHGVRHSGYRSLEEFFVAYLRRVVIFVFQLEVRVVQYGVVRSAGNALSAGDDVFVVEVGDRIEKHAVGEFFSGGGFEGLSGEAFDHVGKEVFRRGFAKRDLSLHVLHEVEIHALLHGRVKRGSGENVGVVEFYVGDRFGHVFVLREEVERDGKEFFDRHRFGSVVFGVLGNRLGLCGNGDRYRSYGCERRGDEERQRDKRGKRFFEGAEHGREWMLFGFRRVVGGSFLRRSSGYAHLGEVRSASFFSKTFERAQRVTDSEEYHAQSDERYDEQRASPSEVLFRPVPLARPFEDDFPVLQNGDPEGDEKEKIEDFCEHVRGLRPTVYGLRKAGQPEKSHVFDYFHQYVVI